MNGDRDIDEGESEDEDEEEDGWKDESSSSDEDQDVREKEPETDSDVEETEARPIQFSRHRDLQSYKAASRPRRIEEPAEAPIEERTEDEVEERIEARIPVEERRAPRENPHDPRVTREDENGSDRGTIFIPYESARQDRHEYGRDSGYVSREYQGEAEIAPEAEAETERKLRCRENRHHGCLRREGGLAGHSHRHSPGADLRAGDDVYHREHPRVSGSFSIVDIDRYPYHIWSGNALEGLEVDTGKI